MRCVFSAARLRESGLWFDEDGYYRGDADGDPAQARAARVPD